MSKLRVWNTPFKDDLYPAIWVEFASSFENTAVCIDSDKKWRITFENLMGIKVCDESYDKNIRFHITREGTTPLCTYTWQDSPWLADFNYEIPEIVFEKPVIHYVLLGGDYNIEVLAASEAFVTPQ